MRRVADLHIHSHFSRATSPDLVPEHLDHWARLKGIHVLGTGDCVHPGWLDELEKKLVPTGNGFYRLKPEYRLRNVPSAAGCEEPTSFVLTTEISSIYKKGGKVRKVHNLCVFADFEAARHVQARLERIGNIRSDGRPILGLDSRDLLEIVLESSPRSFLIPAHIWTPWFSVLGSRSGFDSVEECFGDLTGEIFAVETGLSSDPPMNWACSFLDRFRLVSNSDAHSPQKLGREANLFETELSFDAMREALRTGVGCAGTIEFFPEEGKYHYDGHRACNIRWNPLETVEHRALCPACGKPVTVGVLHRVAELADRADPSTRPERDPFHSITPLPELLAEIMGQKGSDSKKVQKEFFRLLGEIGPEFEILLFAEIEAIRAHGGEVLAEGIARLRRGAVHVESGYDGEFGRIKVFTPGEIEGLSGDSLFAVASPAESEEREIRWSIDFEIEEFRRLKGRAALTREAEATPTTTSASAKNIPQEEAIEAGEGAWLVLAGPGTGKTHALTRRIEHLVIARGVAPASILAVTFSKKAAEEMRRRLAERLTGAAGGVTVRTFHALGLAIITRYAESLGRTAAFELLDREERDAIVAKHAGWKKREAARNAAILEKAKAGAIRPDAENVVPVLAAAEEALQDRDAFDLDDLVFQAVRVLRENASVRAEVNSRFRWILVDECQDMNPMQAEFLRLLAPGEDPNLFLIGDPDQAIYGFRGADSRLLDELRKDLPRLRTVALATSFRCPATVLGVAGGALERTRGLAGVERGPKQILVQECESDRSEADWIAQRIESMIGGVREFSRASGMADGTATEGISGFSDFAILCRISALFPIFEEALQNHGIAYQVVGEEPFHRREPIKGAVKRLRSILCGEEDNAAIEHYLMARASCMEIFENLIDVEKLGRGSRDQFTQFLAGFGRDVAACLRALAMGEGTDDFDPRAERVSLMTIHAAKGLEFEAVFVPACEEGMLPLTLFGAASEEEIAEERRLLYVAVTRSKRHLVLSHATRRVWRGRVLDQRPSPFLTGIRRDLLKHDKRAAKEATAERMQLKLFDLP